jgi:hypothetical protein
MPFEFHQDSLYVLLGYWVFNAAIQAMPEPSPDNKFYHWLYSFGHLLAANIKIATKPPLGK